MEKQRVVISVSGGVVQSVHTDAEVEVVVVDWDQEGPRDEIGQVVGTFGLSEMDQETREQVDWAVE